MYGFEIKNGQLYVIPKEAEIVKKIFHMYLYEGKDCHSSQDVSSAHQKQIDGIRNYIKQVNQTAEMDTDSTKIYGELLKKVVVHEGGITDFYLTCVPFGFRMIYHLHRYNRGHQLDVFVDNCEVIY